MGEKSGLSVHQISKCSKNPISHHKIYCNTFLESLRHFLYDKSYFMQIHQGIVEI